MYNNKEYHRKWREEHGGYQKEWRNKNKKHVNAKKREYRKRNYVKEYVKKYNHEHKKDKRLSYLKNKEKNRENRRLYQKLWREQNNNKYKMYKRRHYLKHREKECLKNGVRAKVWYKQNKEKVRIMYYKRLYGVTVEQKEQMRISQDNKCAICGSVFINTKSTHIDHNHETGQIRQLLCAACNAGLGQFKENINSLQKAIQYLEKWGQK